MLINKILIVLINKLNFSCYIMIFKEFQLILLDFHNILCIRLYIMVFLGCCMLSMNLVKDGDIDFDSFLNNNN